MKACNINEWTIFHYAMKSALPKAVVCITVTFLSGRILNANDLVIKECARCEALFTVQQINLNNKKVFAIDRVIKGNVNARIMAHIQTGSQLSYTSKQLVFVIFPGLREIRSSAVNSFGQFEYEINGTNEKCSLNDLIFELDQSPRGEHARSKRNEEKTNSKGKSGKTNPAPYNLPSGQRQPSRGEALTKSTSDPAKHAPCKSISPAPPVDPQEAQGPRSTPNPDSPHK